MQAWSVDTAAGSAPGGDSRAARSGWLRLLRELAVFALLLLVPLGWIELELRSIPTSYSWKRNAMQEQAGELRVLVLGSSQALDGVDPAQFSLPGYNLANVSQSLTIDLQLLAKYFDDLPRLRLVILTLSYFSLEYRLAATEEYWRNYFYVHTFGIRGDMDLGDLLDARLFSMYALYTPRVANPIIFSGFARPTARTHRLDASVPRSARLQNQLLLVRPSESGWQRISRKRTGELSERDGRGRANRHTGLMNEEFLPDNLRRVREAIRRASERGVAVALVLLPTHSTYSEGVDEEKLARLRRTLEATCGSTEAACFDYFEDGRFESDDFIDSVHLNALGAQKLSRMLDAEVVRPLGGEAG